MQPPPNAKPRTSYARLRVVAYTSLVVSIIAMICVGVLAVELMRATETHSTTTTTLAPISVTGQLITPPTSLSDAPPILAQQTFGQRLTDINVPFNSSQLAVINDGPDSYFETAAQMYLNGSLTNIVGAQVAQAPLFTVNGKPTVTYLGAISCVYCGENRWAMALALGRFGSFGNLFMGYSALGDSDVPTIYWAPAHYNSTSGVDWGNFYNGTYVNFLSIDYASEITAGFQMQSLSYFQQQAKLINNTVYETATNLFVSQNNYVGTPYTIWGTYNPLSADASDFGDTTTATSSGAATTAVPMASLTHEQILESFADPTTQFAWTEYAAADYYIAFVCATLGGTSSMSPAICSSPGIVTMTQQVKSA